ncbi:MAG: DUF1580 domain-containing protein [Planctomycetes bacterium]|nr:DUF1580 domain-containing protein [Planctomycetota bacterium]
MNDTDSAVSHDWGRAGDDMATLIPLGKAAAIVPGRPSTSTVWRWCRKGVMARNGQRVRLEHVRAGGKVLTKAAYVHQFMKRLAEADTVYFEAKDAAAKQTPPRDPAFGPPSRKRRPAPTPIDRRGLDECLDRELREEGL